MTKHCDSQDCSMACSTNNSGARLRTSQGCPRPDVRNDAGWRDKINVFGKSASIEPTSWWFVWSSRSGSIKQGVTTCRLTWLVTMYPWCTIIVFPILSPTSTATCGGHQPNIAHVVAHVRARWPRYVEAERRRIMRLAELAAWRRMLATP